MAVIKSEHPQEPVRGPRHHNLSNVVRTTLLHQFSTTFGRGWTDLWFAPSGKSLCALEYPGVLWATLGCHRELRAPGQGGTSQGFFPVIRKIRLPCDALNEPQALLGTIPGQPEDL